MSSFINKSAKSDDTERPEVSAINYKLLYANIQKYNSAPNEERDAESSSIWDYDIIALTGEGDFAIPQHESFHIFRTEKSLLGKFLLLAICKTKILNFLNCQSRQDITCKRIFPDDDPDKGIFVKVSFQSKAVIFFALCNNTDIGFLQNATIEKEMKSKGILPCILGRFGHPLEWSLERIHMLHNRSAKGHNLKLIDYVTDTLQLSQINYIQNENEQISDLIFVPADLANINDVAVVEKSLRELSLNSDSKPLEFSVTI